MEAIIRESTADQVVIDRATLITSLEDAVEVHRLEIEDAQAFNEAEIARVATAENLKLLLSGEDLTDEQREDLIIEEKRINDDTARLEEEIRVLKVLAKDPVYTRFQAEAITAPVVTVSVTLRKRLNAAFSQV